MREAGTAKLKRGDLEDADRTRIQPKKILKKREEITEDTPAVDAPMEPLDDTMIGEDSDAPVLEAMNEPDDMIDTSNFYEEVNDDIGRVEYEGPDLHDPDQDHIMSTMMDVLQTCGVSASDSANYCAKVIKDKPVKASQYGDHYKPTFFDIYGQGNIVQASHGCRRNLNVDGLKAFDLRTFKPNGQAWEFHKAADRREERRNVAEEIPRWII